MKPSGTPIAMAKAIAAKTSLSDGHTRSPTSLVTGSRVRNEVPRSPVAVWSDVLGEALGERIVEPHLLAHALHHRRIDACGRPPTCPR